MDTPQTNSPFSPPLPAPAKEDKSKMYLVVLLLVALLVGAGIWYFGMMAPGTDDGRMAPSGSQMPMEPDVAALNTQSSSDEVSAIENDLNATELNNLDMEMNAMEQELGF